MRGGSLRGGGSSVPVLGTTCGPWAFCGHGHLSVHTRGSECPRVGVGAHTWRGVSVVVFYSLFKNQGSKL